MLNYCKPTFVECGNSEEIIQGECGWGMENMSFDKTGATKSNHTIRKYGPGFVCPGPGVINICHRCETGSASCSTDSDEC